MTKLIGKDDPLYFGQTSEPYDRHHDKIVSNKDHAINLGMKFKSGGGIIVPTFDAILKTNHGF